MGGRKSNAQLAKENEKWAAAQFAPKAAKRGGKVRQIGRGPAAV